MGEGRLVKSVNLAHQEERFRNLVRTKRRMLKERRQNLNNLTNKYYYDQIHPAHIVPGAGFTALIGLNFKF